MSNSNRHQHNRINSISLNFMNELFPNRKKCPRKSCKGIMVEVLSRYFNQGPINYEQECTMCGKVIKDPKFKQEREANWKKKKKHKRWKQGDK
jgi:hypothetical protein